VYEVEVKFSVADRHTLEQKLLLLAGQFREPVEQVDLYFAHPSRDFARTDEALRLRRVGPDVAITWKGPRLDTATKTRREIELPLVGVAASRPDGPPATLERWTELLEALGFRRVLEVAKQRVSARVRWEGAEVDVALDRVGGLGEFVELELQAYEGEVQLAQARVLSLARELGCGTPEKHSYLEMLLASRKT
jgi:adenylate cyclase class 2